MKFTVCRRPNRDGSSTYFLRYRPAGYKGPQKSVPLPGVTRLWEAQAAAARHEADSADGVLPCTSKETLAAYLTRWLAGRRRLQYNSVAGYRTMAAQATDAFGPQLKLVDLRRDHVEAWVSALTARYKPTTVQTRMHAFRLALADAVKDGLIRENPAQRVELPRLNKPSRDAYSAEEVVRLLVVCRGYAYPYGAMYATMLLTGLRLGEVMALPAGAIDLDRGRIEVAVQVQREYGVRVLKDPKMGSRGTVAIPALLRPFLEAALAARPDVLKRNEGRRPGKVAASWALLFVTQRAYMTEPHRVRAHIYAMQDLADVARSVPHASRHTAGTLVMDATGDERDAQTLLRHASRQVTQRYVHQRINASQERAAAGLDRLLRESGA